MIRDETPFAVIGLGGYASAPIVWAASRARIPVVLLEQNVIPGRATRWLSNSADVVCTSFLEAAKSLPRRARVQCTGNPVRQQIAALYANPFEGQSGTTKQILILGGSQGADSLNDAVVEAVRLLRTEISGWKLFHQTGPRRVQEIRSHYEALSIAAQVEPFFEEMTRCYRDASIVISRAGATTLAEVTCRGLPMILLPYPHAADDHQRANAKSLQNRGAAVVVEHQSTAQETGSALALQLRLLLLEPERCALMGIAARTLARPNAAAEVADLIQSIGKK